MIPSLTSRPFEAVVYLGPKWAKENGRAVVLASGQVEGVLRMNNQTSFMMEDLLCVRQGQKRFISSLQDIEVSLYRNQAVFNIR